MQKIFYNSSLPRSGSTLLQNVLNQNPKEGTLISLENIGEVVMPVNLTLEDAQGNLTKIHIPVEFWMRGDVAKYKVNTTSKIIKVIIDPEQLYPDIDLSNNVWLVDKPLQVERKSKF